MLFRRSPSSARAWPCATSCRGTRPSRCSAGTSCCPAPRSRRARPASAGLLRRHRRRRPDHPRRAAAHAAADGARHQGPRDGPLRVDRVHLGQRRPRRSEKFEESGLDARAFSGLKIAAVGGVTANALREWGLVPDLVPSGEQSAAGLLADWPEYDDVLDRSTGSSSRAPTSPPTPSSPVSRRWAGRSTTSRPTGPSGPPRRPRGPRRDQVGRLRRRRLHELDGPQPRQDRRQAAPVDRRGGHRPGHGQGGRGGGLHVDVMAPEASSDALVDALAAHGLGLAVAAQEAGEPVLRPNERSLRPSPRR